MMREREHEVEAIYDYSASGIIRGLRYEPSHSRNAAEAEILIQTSMPNG